MSNTNRPGKSPTPQSGSGPDSELGTTKEAERRRVFLTAYRDRMRNVVARDGTWNGSEREMGFREKMWHALALMQGEDADAAVANAVIQTTELRPCAFTPMTALQILSRSGDRVDGNSLRKLDAYLAENIPAVARNERLHVSMYNDNFAVMAAFMLLAGGERLGQSGAVRRGEALLGDIERLFERCGSLMEYNSPTYTVISLAALAEIANLVSDGGVRSRARKLERLLWADLLSHFHLPTSRLAGPYSRAYLIDSVGHPHLTHVVMQMVFGSNIFSGPHACYFPPAEGQVGHVGFETLTYPNSAWLASVEYHCPQELAARFLARRYPFECVATSECLPSTIAGKGEAPTAVLAFPAYRAPYTTYSSEDFALGTAATQFHDGAISDSFHITYRRRAPAKRLEDTGVVLARFTTARRTPEAQNVYAVSGTAGPETFRDEGRKHSIQERNSALCLYKPTHLELEPEVLRLSIIIPLHFDADPKLHFSAGEVADFPYRCEAPESFVVSEGPFSAVFRPLEISDLGRECATEAEVVGNYLFISWYNYSGGGRRFTMDELVHARSGFAVHVFGENDENGAPDAAELLRAVGNGTIDDRVFTQEGALLRWVRYRNDELDTDLEYAYSPRSEGTMIATIHGKPRPAPVFSVNGRSAEESRRLPDG